MVYFKMNIYVVWQIIYINTNRLQKMVSFFDIFLSPKQVDRADTEWMEIPDKPVLTDAMVREETLEPLVPLEL
jgi:hypothetical protein